MTEPLIEPPHVPHWANEPRTTLFSRLSAEASSCSAWRRSVFEAQAAYRDSGAPMWPWLTGAKA